MAHLQETAEKKIVAICDINPQKLEKATLDVIEEGRMTGDLARLASPAAKEILDSWQFIDKIAERLN